MTSIRKLGAVVALSTVLANPATAQSSISLGVKASLQATMQQHIDRRLVEGIYLHLDPVTGNVRELHPLTAHPVILRMGEYFVLCSDFRDDSGKHINIDFYIAPRGATYTVFSTVVANRKLLDQLMKTGKVERVD